MVAALAVALVGCSGVLPTSTPTDTPPPSSPASTAGRPTTPPLATDLTGGIPLDLGSAGHWAIAMGRAFVAGPDGTVTAIDLATGDVAWQATFTLGQPWDVQPMLGLSTDRATVIATRTVDDRGTAHLDLLLLDAASGAPAAEYLVADPAGKWIIDLPPLILAADASTVVLADNPESGLQTAVIDLTTGTLAWRAEEPAVAADETTVVTRAGGRNRADGASLWQATAPLGPLLGQAPGVVVAAEDAVAVWLDPATGRELARATGLGEAEPPCAATADTLVCVTEGVTGYDLTTGEQRWTSPEPATGVATLFDWAYLWRATGGDVVDARTGEVLVSGAELPHLRYSDDTGILVGAEYGQLWYPFR